MLNVRQILVSALGLAVIGVALTGCGQKGSLYLPTDPVARDRSTLPGLLLPTPPASEAKTPPSKPPADVGSEPEGAAK